MPKKKLNLPRCLHCNAPADYFEMANAHAVMCLGCGVRVYADTKSKVIAAWNRRPQGEFG